MKKIARLYILMCLCAFALCATAQTYKYENINGFSQDTNCRLK